MYLTIASIWASSKTWPKAGIAPSLPVLMRLRMKSSLRAEFMSWGPFPAARPPSEWHQPQVEAKSSWTSKDASDGAAACWAAAGIPARGRASAALSDAARASAAGEFAYRVIEERACVRCKGTGGRDVAPPGGTSDRVYF